MLMSGNEPFQHFQTLLFKLLFLQQNFLLMLSLNAVYLLDFLGYHSINTSSAFAQVSLVCLPFGHSYVLLVQFLEELFSLE